MKREDETKGREEGGARELGTASQEQSLSVFLERPQSVLPVQCCTGMGETAAFYTQAVEPRRGQSKARNQAESVTLEPERSPASATVEFEKINA